MVPGPMLRSDGPWTSIWMTDGDKLSKDGRDYTLPNARSAILAELASSAKTFPFRVEGQIFHQIVEQAPGRYVIVLVDPGWLNPAERVVTLAAQLPGAWRVTDRLSGAPLDSLDRSLTLRVPAGAFRLVEVSR
jgi:hypothetical protein